MSRRAKVTFDYQATEKDELDLVVGQIIENITDEDEGWCKGFLNGKTGLFPNNFVEFIAGEAPPHSKPLEDSLAGKKAKVTFEYDAANEDELSLKVGDIIEVICEVEDGWWEGKYQGKTGVFPSNFVDLVKESEPPPLPPTKEEIKEPAAGLDEEEGNKRASIIGQAKKMGGGMGFGNIINAGVLSGTKLKKVDTKPKKEPEPEVKPPPDVGSSLKKVSSGSSIKRKAPPVPPPAVPQPAVPAPVKKVERAKVMFDYEKQNDDELDLVVGDIVTVLNKEIEDTDGWWEGELNGKKGLFPDNFVELLPDEEEVKEKPKHVHRKPAVPPGVDKSAPPPIPDQESHSASELHKKDMKKASDHEPPKLPPPKQNAKPSLPLKKPVPPKPSTKPMLPTKKPVPKPPTEPKREGPSKTTKDQDLLRSSLKDEKRPSDARNTNEEYNLDVVAPHEPLKQLTANRAGKQQSKRPPSTTRHSEDNLMDDLTSIDFDEAEKEKPAQIEPKEPAWKREATKAREEREAKKLIEESAPSPVPAAKEKKVPPLVLGKSEEIIEKRKSWLKDDTITKKPVSAPSEEVSGLRKEVTELRALVANMEKKMAAMERKHEEDLKVIEKRLLKEIEQLTSDFDEERTNHARLKIDMDRLKKKLRRDSGSIEGDESSHA